ncbi:receptor activity-modifying protein 2-like isoform 1-T1 [Trichechus inunguis]
MVSLRGERAASGPRLPATRAGRPAALRLLLLLGAVLKTQESLAQPLTTPGSLKSEVSNGLSPSHPTKPLTSSELAHLTRTMVEQYETNVQSCWLEYKKLMDPLEKDWCDWAMISRPYSFLRDCLEFYADYFDLGFPNPWAERVIFKTHQMHFANCSLLQSTFCDPPEDVLLAMIIAPICLIPFLVTLVVWQSKDGEARA